MPRRSDFNYAQSAIGSCGHITDGWPAVYMLGEALPWVPCEVCTAEQFDVTGERVGIWVRATVPEEKKQRAKARREAKKKSASAKPARTPMPWEQFLT